MEKSEEQAITCLRYAVRYAHPLTLLLPYWPIFDRLRNHPDFAKLISEINLPLKRD